MEIHHIGVMDTLVPEFNFSDSTSSCKFNPRPLNVSQTEYPYSYPDFIPNPASSVESRDSVVDSPEDTLDAGLKFISQVLMEEEDLERKPCMFQECLALQAAEKSFYAVIGENYPPVLENEEYPFASCQDSGTENGNFLSGLEPYELSSYEFRSEGGDLNLYQPFSLDNARFDKAVVDPIENERVHMPSGSGGKRNYLVDNRDDGRSNKQLAANYVEESDEQLMMFDKVLLCSTLNPNLHKSPTDNDASKNKAKIQVKKSNRGRPRKNQVKDKEVVDLSRLLTQCAQAVANNDGRTVNELLIKIRQHSSQYGDGSERLAHYLANALEQRLAGEGARESFITNGISAKDLLKGFQVFLQACPFKKISNFYANKSIFKLVKQSKRVHIIDFGILYGFQWPCLIQLLSRAPDGPPKLRITGIDLPQPGLRPAERVEEAGQRLKKYCDRFGVPFEYTAIAKKWDAIKLEEIKLEKDEIVIVNCLHRLRNVPDDSVVTSNPRDTVLNLIHQINPDLFVHGVVNGTYNTPFFLNRFRETFFFYSAMFDMFDATIDRENQDWRLYEREMFGKDLMNVIACEGTERVERPETYRQWQVRNTRAGFVQVALDKELVGAVRDTVRQGYHNDFVVDEDGKWLLQGWKGRITCAISCWKPIRELY